MDARYDHGGTIYNQVRDKYGPEAAERVYRAAQSGDQEAIGLALAEIRHGPALNESETAIFLHDIATDPFAAPIEAANNQLSKIGLNLLKNPLAALAIVGATALLFLAYVPGAKSFFSRLIGMK